MSAIDPPEASRLPAIIRLIDRMSGLAGILAAAAVVMLVVNVFVDVVGRTFFSAPFQGTLEMTANWWMPTLVLLAFAFTEREQEHIKVTVLLDVLPPRMRRYVEGVFGLIAAGILLALTVYTFQGALKAEHIGQTTAGTPPVLIWPFKFVAFAGVGLMTLQTVATAWRYFTGHLPRVHEYSNDADLG
ncbi:TRAP transporter small permease subunit [Martelella soudanensis]|uniref:TRAP transporter small permease subunit n=1 Tax=unclassified Martelella TaxID=2629616 RepID=UPI0015DE9D0D|nr:MULTISPECIES: TRAP transporter small permease [unclassified Martelella]